ncbi:MAG TPA: hypothetical protein VGF02_07650 [Pseudolabrys sp.]|jgi:hypothetical protein
MTNEEATDRIKRKLDDALDTMRSDLDRVELLAVALNTFSRPIPDYEPTFRHVRQLTLNSHMLG